MYVFWPSYASKDPFEKALILRIRISIKFKGLFSEDIFLGHFRKNEASKGLFEKKKNTFNDSSYNSKLFQRSFQKDMTLMSNLLENGYCKGIFAFENRL